MTPAAYDETLNKLRNHLLYTVDFTAADGAEPEHLATLAAAREALLVTAPRRPDPTDLPQPDAAFASPFAPPVARPAPMLVPADALPPPAPSHAADERDDVVAGVDDGFIAAYEPKRPRTTDEVRSIRRAVRHLEKETGFPQHFGRLTPNDAAELLLDPVMPKSSCIFYEAEDATSALMFARREHDSVSHFAVKVRPAADHIPGAFTLRAAEGTSYGSYRALTDMTAAHQQSGYVSILRVSDDAAHTGEGLLRENGPRAKRGQKLPRAAKAPKPDKPVKHLRFAEGA